MKIVNIPWTPDLNSSVEAGSAVTASGLMVSVFCQAGDSLQTAGPLLSLHTPQISTLVPTTNPLSLLNGLSCTV